MKLPSYEKLKISKISRSLQGRESGSDINQRSVRGLTNMMGRSNMGRAKSNTRKRGFEAERQVLQVDSLKENKTNEFCLKIIDVRAQITETMIRSDTRVCLKLNKTSKFRQDRIIKSTRSSYKQSTLSFTIFLAATFIFISLLVPIQDARANQIESSEHLWEEERQQKQQQQVNDYNINKNQQDLKSSASEYGRISVDGRGFSGSQLKDSVRKRSADIRMSEVDEVSSGQSNNNKAKLGPLGCKQDCSEHNQFRNKRDVGISSQQSGFASNQNEANLPTCNQLVSSWTYLKNKFPALAARLSNVGSAQGRRRALSLNSISKQTELNFLLERANRLLAEDVGGQQDSSTRSRVAKLLANYMLNPNNAKFLRRYQLLESVRSKYHPLGENVHENHPSISLTPFNDASRSSGVENENNNINGHERAQSSGESTSINTKSNSNSNNNNIISSNEGNEPQRDINLLDSRGRYNTQLSDMPAQTDFKISNRKEPQNYTYGRVINYPHERQSQSSGITTGKIHKLHHITRLIETRAHHNNNHNNRSPENEMHFKVVEPDMVVDRLDNGNDLLNNEQRNQANESPTWPQVEEPQLQAGKLYDQLLLELLALPIIMSCPLNIKLISLYINRGIPLKNTRLNVLTLPAC